MSAAPGPSADAGRAPSASVLRAYAAAVRLGGEVRQSALDAGQMDFRKARHVTQALVDRALSEPRSLLALTTIKEADDTLPSHAANVAVLSVLVGRRLGLGKARLGELCLAALLHDAGRLELPPEVLGKPGPLVTEEWEELRRHPVLAAHSLLPSRAPSPATMRAVVVAYEHHLNHDASGYPESPIHRQVSLYGGIVALADRYDALTTARAYRRFSFSPHEVVGYLVYHAGSFFDPMLVKLFVGVVGIHPPGTLLRLTNGELGVVCEPPGPTRALDRPRVRIWTGERRGAVVDLGDAGEDALGIAMVLSPAGMGQAPALQW